MTDKADLYQEAMKFAKEKASISYVQRKCRCRYNDAERMLEQMVSEGVISTYGGRKSDEAVGAGGAQELSTVPVGWKLVPVKITPQMGKAAADAWLDCGSRMVLNKAAAALAAGIAASPTPPAEQPAPKAAPSEGNWISAVDVQRLVRELDAALNGEEGAAPQASLCDIVSQVAQAAKALGRPVLTAPKAAPQQEAQEPSNNCGRCSGSGEDPEGYYDQSRGDAGATLDGPCRDCDGTGTAPQPAPAPLSERDGWLSQDDMTALERVDECFEDGQGYDVPKARMKRLAELGVVQSLGFAKYDITSFGRYILGSDHLRKPLETVDECNTRLGREHHARRAALAAQQQ